MEISRGSARFIKFFVWAYALFFLFVTGSSNSYSTFSKLELPPGATAPTSAAFDFIGVGPYTTIVDGRILKWLGQVIGFVEFAYTSPNRTKQLCDGTTNPDLGPVCGRPFGLSFNYLTGKLYIADAYFGLLVVTQLGGLATQLVTSAEGIPLKLTNGVDVDLSSGLVYFTDSTETFQLRDTSRPGFKPDSTGRLLRYDPFTNQVTVLLRGLYGTGGTAVSSDGTYVLVSEIYGGRVLKYWLTGPKANSAELILAVSGNIYKVRRASTPGEFWVAVVIKTPTDIVPQGFRIDGNGTVLQTVSFATQYFNTIISIVQEQKGSLYVGSGSTSINFIGVYSD